MNKLRNIPGFTLIELVAVIAIIALMLVFTIPMFQKIDLVSNSSNQVGELANLIQSLKRKSVVEKKDYVLHLDAGSGSVWVTDEFMDEEKKINSKNDGQGILSNIDILGIEFPESEMSDSSIDLNFRKQGYSDMALIHVRNDEGQDFTLKIEPFLYEVEQINKYFSYNDCI